MTLVARSRNGSKSFVAPRPYFKRKLIGVPVSASIRWGFSAKLPKPSTSAQLNGIRFEKKVCDLLSRTYTKQFVPGPTLLFKDSRLFSKPSVAIPDGLLFSEDFKACAVIEVKFRHSLDAWFQLDQFYLPIVRKALPGIRVIPLEICKFYDPDVKLENVRVRAATEDLSMLFAPWNALSYNVWLWGDTGKWVSLAGSRQSFNSSSGKSECLAQCSLPSLPTSVGS